MPNLTIDRRRARRWMLSGFLALALASAGLAAVEAPKAEPTPEPISSLFLPKTQAPAATPAPSQPTPPPEAFQKPVLQDFVPPRLFPTPPGPQPTGTPQPTPNATPKPTPQPTPTPTPIDKKPFQIDLNALLTPTPTPAATPEGPRAPAPTPPATPTPAPLAPPSAERPLDLNAAGIDELTLLPGVGLYRAELILAHRRALGGFDNVGQLREVFGIPERLFRELAPVLRVGPKPPARPIARATPEPDRVAVPAPRPLPAASGAKTAQSPSTEPKAPEASPGKRP